MESTEPLGATNMDTEANYELQYAVAQETLDHFNKPKLNLLEGVEYDKELITQVAVFVAVFFAIVFLLRRWCRKSKTRNTVYLPMAGDQQSAHK